MWILFATLNPVSESLRSLFAKRASRNVDPLIISWFNNVIPVIIFLPFLFFIELEFNSGFWLGLLGSGAINVLATILYMKAISEGDISVVMPILSFTPLFLLITGPVIIGEFPTLLGLAGVLLIVIGSYILNLHLKEKKILYPIISLFKSKGSRYMFIVSVIWSISANFDKISINNSSVLQHIIFVNIFIISSLSIIVAIKDRRLFGEIRRERKNLLIISCFTAGSFIFHMTALSMTLVAYVVALKRMSGFISVILGGIFLKEQNIKERLLGAVIMFMGVILIILSAY